MDDGWIKSHRKIMNKGWYKKSEYFHLWHHLLYKAAHKPNEWIYKNQPFKVNTGQLVASRKSLSKETGINESKVERILKCFEIEQQIEQQNLYTSRLISITNYEIYQQSEQQNGQQVNSKRTASEQPVNTNKNDKKVKNDNNIDIPFEKFWELYDKKVGDKQRCEKKWEKLKPAEREKIIETLPQWKTQIRDRQFQPYPETYINQRRWNDEIKVEQQIIKSNM